MPRDEIAKSVRRRRHIAWLAWRTLALVAVFTCGVIGFRLGVSTDARPDLASASVLTQLYCAIGLFVLGGLDLGMPIGGDTVARTLVWFAYFAAPAITASAVVEGVLRAIEPNRWRLRRLRGHVVIAGCGRLSMLYLQRLRKVLPSKPVVIVEKLRDNRALTAARDAYGAHVVHGDICSEPVLSRLALERSDWVFLFTGDDFVNLDAATRVLEYAPDLARKTAVQVGDIGFMRSVEGTHVGRKCRIVNKHQIAASHLVSTVLRQRFEDTTNQDIVVLAGFGRFGQTVLDELQKETPGAFDNIVIVDLQADTRALLFEEQVGFSNCYQRELVNGDLRDPTIWRAIESRYDFNVHPAAFVLASGDDGTNIRTAMRISRRYPHAYVVARSFGESSFAQEVSRDAGFATFSVAKLVSESMPDEWFY